MNNKLVNDYFANRWFRSTGLTYLTFKEFFKEFWVSQYKASYYKNSYLAVENTTEGYIDHVLSKMPEIFEAVTGTLL